MKCDGEDFTTNSILKYKVDRNRRCSKFQIKP